jgi:hypothetical protein
MEPQTLFRNSVGLEYYADIVEVVSSSLTGTTKIFIMEKVKIGEFKVGDNLIIDFGENNPNNKEVQVRAIIDMEVVILMDKNQNYLMETVKYMNLLCRFGNVIRED